MLVELRALSQGRTLAVVWNLGEGSIVRLVEVAVGGAFFPAVALSGAGGQERMAISDGQVLEIWSLDEADQREPVVISRHTLSEPGDAAQRMIYSPDGATLLIATRSDLTLLVDAASGDVLQRFAQTGDVDFDPSGPRMLVGDRIIGAEP